MVQSCLFVTSRLPPLALALFTPRLKARTFEAGREGSVERSSTSFAGDDCGRTFPGVSFRGGENAVPSPRLEKMESSSASERSGSEALESSRLLFGAKFEVNQSRKSSRAMTAKFGSSVVGNELETRAKMPPPGSSQVSGV